MTMPDPVSPSGSSLKSKSDALVLGAERGAVRGACSPGRPVGSHLAPGDHTLVRREKEVPPD